LKTPVITIPGAWRRFRGNRSARAGLFLLGLLSILALGGLPFSIRWYNTQALDRAVRLPPAFEPSVPLDRFTETPETSPGRGASVAHRMTSWLGHDDLGRSLLFRLLLALLISLGIGLAAATLTVLIGTTWGAVAALVGGRLDFVLMRFVDVLYGLPYTLLIILMKVGLTRPVSSLLGFHQAATDMVILFTAIGSVSWLTMARVIRGQVLSLKSQPFVDAARAAGAGPGRILFRHLLPNLAGPIVVYATLAVPQAILQESFLSFLGIGIRPPIPSLGRLASEGVFAVNGYVSYWWLLLYPCGTLFLTLLALNFVGDGLRDAVDPKSTSALVV